jgi:hypothetical protein
MAEQYDPIKDSRPPCEFPQDGDISIEDFESKYKDCKIDWSKEDSREEPKALHFTMGYSEKPREKGKQMSEEVKTEVVGPQPLVVEPPSLVTSVQQVPAIDAAAHKEMLAKAADPATVAAITATVASVAVNAGMSAAMKHPKVKEVMELANDLLNKVSKGKLGKKKVEGEKQQQEEKQEEQGGECKAQHMQANAALAAMKADLTAIQAQLQSLDSGSSLELQSNLEDRIKKLEKQLKKTVATVEEEKSKTPAKKRRVL